MQKLKTLVLGLGAVGIACSSGTPKGAATTPTSGDKGELFGQPCAMEMLDMPDSDESAYGPLEVGSDWESYEKMNKAPVPSKTHGGRFVDTYVNTVGAAAYKGDDAPIPVGTVIVKTSWESKDGQPTTVPGPIFVMKKMEPGYAPDHEDWYYGIHWAEPTPGQLKYLKGPIYWRGKSPKVSYCVSCHDNYDRELGSVPPDYRAWTSAGE
jgi:hypothetical protein